MLCPNCGNKFTAVIVYGYCEDEKGNEYPFDARVYETGGSLPAWGINEKYNGYYMTDGDWPTRYCYECHTRFSYQPEKIAMNVDREDAIRIANEEAHQALQWESIEKMQEMYPYIEWGWMGFVMVGFDRVILDSEEVEIAKQLYTE